MQQAYVLDFLSNKSDLENLFNHIFNPLNQSQDLQKNYWHAKKKIANITVLSTGVNLITKIFFGFCEVV